MCFRQWGDVGEKGYYEENQSVGNKYSRCGIAVHEVMEYAGIKRMKGEQVYLSELHVLLNKLFDEIPVDMFKDEEDVNAWRDSLHEQIEWLHEQTLLSTSIIDVEMEFEISNMFTDMPPFTGCIDRVEGNLETQDVALIDYKTGKTYTKRELNENIQACIYSLAFFQKYGFMPKEFIFYFSKHKKIKKVMITQEFITRVSAEIVRIVGEMKAKHFDPNPKSKFFCDNFCEFRSECPKYKRKQKQGWEALND